jgi:hypothetical protein
MASVRGWLSFTFIVFCAHLARSFSLSEHRLPFGPGQELPARATAPLPDLYEATLQQLQAGLDAGQFTSVDLVKVNYSHVYRDRYLRLWLRRHTLRVFRRLTLTALGCER